MLKIFKGSCEGQNKTLDSVCLHIFMKIHEDIEQTVYPFACQPEGKNQIFR